MSIATSLDKLSETLTNCKTNLKEKGVEAETIKISDVDEKIAEIQAGGGSGSEIDLSQFGSSARLLLFYSKIDVDTDIKEVKVNGSEVFEGYSMGHFVDTNTFRHIFMINIENISEPFSLSISTSMDGYPYPPIVTENIPVPPEGKLTCYKQQ